MDAISDDAKGNWWAPQQSPHRTRRPVMQPSHGVKAVGEHLAGEFGLKVTFIDIDNPA